MREMIAEKSERERRRAADTRRVVKRIDRSVVTVELGYRYSSANIDRTQKSDDIVFVRMIGVTRRPLRWRMPPNE